MKITTKTGDGGMTSLYDGTRVAKDDLRIELNGQIDELNAALGLCKALDAEHRRTYELIQQNLMVLMGIIANPSLPPRAADLQQLRQTTEVMEGIISAIGMAEKGFNFVLPGKSTADAALHLARTKCRTCERRLITLARQAALPDELRVYLNRLSDYLFALTLSKE